MKLSVITINKDNADGLARTMKSVEEQGCRDFEYIVVDGASTDGSVEVMRNFTARIEANGVSVKSASEPDTGLYNAMNKGIRQASGEYVLMLNSGDYLVDCDVLTKIIHKLDGTDIVQGNIIKARNGKEYVYKGYGKSDIDFIDVQKGHFVHQASFCRRDLFERFGYLDESYRIGGDTVFYIKTLGYGDASFRYVDITVAYFAEGGRSDNVNSEWSAIREEEYRRYAYELFSKRLWDTCIQCDKKIRLYDRLHSHRWSWYIVMGLIRVINIFER